jgi:hypothetical protein
LGHSGLQIFVRTVLVARHDDNEVKLF